MGQPHLSECARSAVDTDGERSETARVSLRRLSKPWTVSSRALRARFGAPALRMRSSFSRAFASAAAISARRTRACCWSSGRLAARLEDRTGGNGENGDSSPFPLVPMWKRGLCVARRSAPRRTGSEGVLEWSPVAAVDDRGGSRGEENVAFGVGVGIGIESIPIPIATPTPSSRTDTRNLTPETSSCLSLVPKSGEVGCSLGGSNRRQRRERRSPSVFSCSNTDPLREFGGYSRLAASSASSERTPFCRLIWAAMP